MKLSLSRRSLTLALAVASMGVTSLVMADPPRRGPEGCDPDGAVQFSERMEKRQTDQLARLYAALKITPAQEAAWKGYADTSRLPKFPIPTKDAEQDAPSRMAQRAEFQRQLAEHMQQEAKAAKALYGQLSPEQRKAFDDFHQPHSPRRGERRPDAQPPADKLPQR